MMTKLTRVVGSLIVVLLLAGCGSAAGDSGSGEAIGLNEDYADALPIPSQLALGSLKLEETDLAIDETQAAGLVPLWQAYQSLSTSDKAAEAEINAVLKQIQGAMTAEQIEAIVAMALTSEDVDTYMQEMAGQFGGRGLFVSRGEGDDSGEGEPRGGFGGGGFPGGGIPGGGSPGGGILGGGIPGEGFASGADAEARATRIAEMGGDTEDMMSAFMDQALINTLVRALQLKTGELDEADLQPDRMMQMLWSVVSETTGIPAETLQEGTTAGATLAEVITAQGGDLEAVKTALRQAFTDAGLGGDDVDQRIESLLNNAPRQAPAGE
jgi:hypothetical protein